ncbi:hypothetical protein Golomagni_07023 [Golovinomyces magnicellulatus]|nr:hypothetical protein Golomagni_07023 [Golovinomyces magnicellulatus]
MVNWNDVNPFSRRESHSPATINTYKVLTALTWLLSVVVSIYDTVQPPREAGIHRILFWSQNYLYPSAFTMNHVMGSIFW